jgi:tRNA (guanine26-N2/guanine27-N2)-dimethyltransferase
LLKSISNFAARAVGVRTMEAEVSIDENSEREYPQILPGIEEPPVAGQLVWHNGKRFTTVKEGLANILIPADIAKTIPNPVKPSEEAQRQSVFYNPIQQFNRDLSVLAIRAFGEGLIKAKRERREKKTQSLVQKGSKRGRKRKIGDVNDRDDSPLADQVDGPENGIRYRGMEEGIGGTNNVIAMEKLEAVRIEGEGGSGITEVQPNQSQGTCVKSDWTPKFSILDALSATGLRALRYCQEISFATSVTANDLSREATASIDLNIKHNRLDDRIVSLTGNAISHMYQVAHGNLNPRSNEGPPPGKYDVIDLDPYGTAAPFLDAAVQALTDGGLLCVTCTDSGVFASGGYPEKTYALYGGLPIKGPYSHEGGLRLILHAIATSAARYGLAIEPLLSLSIDFYVRLFVRVRRSPAEVKFLAGKTMIVYCCDQGCGAWRTQLLARTREMTDKKGGKYHKHSLAQGPSASEYCECCGFKTHVRFIA